MTGQHFKRFSCAKNFQIEVGIGSSMLYTLMRVIDWTLSPSLSKMFDAHLIGQSSDVTLLHVAANNDDGSESSKFVTT